jgi:hypothetical protein
MKAVIWRALLTRSRQVAVSSQSDRALGYPVPPKQELGELGDTAGMNYSSSRIRWLRILGAALAVIVLSFLILMFMITVYALVLAFQARGAPDQNAISHFAARVSPKLMPWLEMLLTLGVALSVARRAQTASIMHGLFIGILAGLLSLAVTLAFGGRLGLRNLLFFLIVVGLGWLGGFVGQKRTGET